MTWDIPKKALGYLLDSFADEIWERHFMVGSFGAVFSVPHVDIYLYPSII